jgi:polysaccharide export outer membrane protein
MSRTCRLLSIVVLLLSIVGLGSCSTVGPYVWVDDYPEPPEHNPGDYQIAPGDLLAIRVYGQDSMSARERVRQDGKVSLPLLGDVQAAGLPTSALAEHVKARLKGYLATPVVSVTVEETKGLSLAVLGEVARPGQYTLEKGSGVLEALAAAGGLTDFSHRDRIFVLRKLPNPARIRLTFEALSRGIGRANTLRLQPADAVVVE